MKTKKLILTSLFIALSIIGANIKLMGTVAMDSMPGFLATLILGPIYGAIIGALGHFATALLSGFPLSLPVHIIISVDMALTMFVVGVLFKGLLVRGKWVAMLSSAIAGILLNGPVSILMLWPILVPVMGKAALIAMTPLLTIAAALNLTFSFTIYNVLAKRLIILKQGA